MPSPRRVVVLASDAAGKTLAELDLARRCDCLVVGIERGDVHIEPSAGARVQRGDVLEVVGRRGDVRDAAARLGRLERPSYETDIGVYAGGIFLGLLIGRLGLDVFGVDFSIGVAGGLLVSGILLGRVRRFGPFHTHVPRAARQLVRDLGILLFVAETGVRAGGSSLAGLRGPARPDARRRRARQQRADRARALGRLPVAEDGLVRRVGQRLRRHDLVVGPDCAAPRHRHARGGRLAMPASYAVASVLVTIAGRLVIVLMG